MKNTIKNISIMIAFLLSLISCEKMMVGEKENNSYENNFQYMWEKYDSHYGLFLVNNIDWNAVYESHIQQARDVNTDEQLFDVIASALSVLNDKHVNLITTDPDLADYNSGHNGPIPAQENYLFETVRDYYLIEYKEETENFGYGKLPDNIGYIRVSAHVDNLSDIKNAMDEALKNLLSTNKIIFDIRNHSGGSDNLSKYIAGRFASSKKLFMTSKKRNGPAHDDFEDMLEWYVEPEGDSQYTKPVILLTTSHTVSAGETFTFAMRQNDNVVQMGETTSGVFSDVAPFQLPNGWLITVSVGDYRGANGLSYEGIGIEPDIYSINVKEDVLSGVDFTLELAMTY